MNPFPECGRLSNTKKASGMLINVLYVLKVFCITVHNLFNFNLSFAAVVHNETLQVGYSHNLKVQG